MVRRKKKESQAKIVTNRRFLEMEEPQEEIELEKEELKAIRRYIG